MDTFGGPAIGKLLIIYQSHATKRSNRALRNSNLVSSKHNGIPISYIFTKQIQSSLNKSQLITYCKSTGTIDQHSHPLYSGSSIALVFN